MGPIDNMSLGVAPTVRKLVMTARPPDSKPPIKTLPNTLPNILAKYERT